MLRHEIFIAIFLFLRIAMVSAEDPIRIFQEGGLSHGIGESLLDSPLLNDPFKAELVIASRSGTTMKWLQQEYGDHQDLNSVLQELTKAGLLSVNNGSVFTTFPILLGEEREQYFGVVNRVADVIYPDFVGQLKPVLDTATAKGWNAWSYHIVWSLIFDSQFVWYEMVERSLVLPITTLTHWVIYPPHPYKTGTNYYPDSEIRDYWVVVSWSPTGANTTGMLGGQWAALYDAALGMPAGPSLKELGLMDNHGLVTFPVIKKDDPYFDALRYVAVSYVKLLEKHLPLSEFQKWIREDQKFTWAVVYHDISWEILNRLEADSLIVRPVALSNQRSDINFTGVCSVVPVYQPFLNQIQKALENPPDKNH